MHLVLKALILLSFMYLPRAFRLRLYGGKKGLYNSQNRQRSKKVWQAADNNEGISEFSRKWEFGTFTSKTMPSKEDLANFEAFKRQEGGKDRHIEAFWLNELTEEQLDKGIETLHKYCSHERLQKFEKVLSTRTSNIRMVYENPSNANNVWASLRTFDAFGIQYIDVITDPSSFHSEWRKEVMSSAMGSQKWLSLNSESDTAECINKLKAQGYKIMASDLHEAAKSIHDVDWANQKSAIVMGNEETGISKVVKDLADDSFYIPMKGFVESLNLSAASAIISAVLESKGALPADLTEVQRKRVLLGWMSRTVSRSPAILRQSAGLPIRGNMLYPKVGQYTPRP